MKFYGLDIDRHFAEQDLITDKETEMHKPPSNKPTQVQLIIAEALRIARNEGFEAGVKYLQNSGNSRFQGDNVRAFFAEKCHEHKIKSPLFTVDL